jgi:ankyrin repeat protein
MSGNLDTVKLLFERTLVTPEIINMKDKHKKTTLMWACDGGNLDIVKMLLERGGVKIINDINTIDNYYRTALSYADMHPSYSDSIDKTTLRKYLIEKGAKLPSLDSPFTNLYYGNPIIGPSLDDLFKHYENLGIAPSS